MGFSGVLVVVVYNPCALWPGLGPREVLLGGVRLSCGAFVGYFRTRSLRQCENLRLASGEDFQKLQLALTRCKPALRPAPRVARGPTAWLEYSEIFQNYDTIGLMVEESHK
jgi:hypothetical protein